MQKYRTTYQLLTKNQFKKLDDDDHLHFILSTVLQQSDNFATLCTYGVIITFWIKWKLIN